MNLSLYIFIDLLKYDIDYSPKLEPSKIWCQLLWKLFKLIMFYILFYTSNFAIVKKINSKH